MRFQNIFLSIGVTAGMGLSAFAADKAESLPTIKKDGREYYQYSAAGGESLYGVAKEMDWDYDLLEALNPDISGALNKGYILIYPVDILSTEDVTAVETDTRNPAARRWNNEGNQKDYALSAPRNAREVNLTRQTNFDTDESEDPYSSISNRNPLQGLQRDKLMDYTIQPGDTPLSIANDFNTTVRDIFFLNKTLSDYWFPVGAEINILPGSRDLDHHMATVITRVKTGEESYKVKQDDTLQSIAKQFGITIEELKEANPDLLIKKGKKIVIPIITVNRETKDVVFTDPRERTAAGRAAIHQEVHDYGKPERNSRNIADIVILSSTGQSDLNRDGEFMRGFLLGVDALKLKGKEIGIQFIDITDTRHAASYMREVKSNRPDVIVTTFERSLPEDLAAYAERYRCKLVNVFDAKSETFETNPEVMQVLQPSTMMNEGLADDVLSRFSRYNFVFLEDSPADSDSFASIVKTKLKSKNIVFEELESPSALMDKDLISSKPYVIVSNASTQNALEASLNAVKALKGNNPGKNVVLIGRPTWIVYGEKFSDAMKECDTYIPSRFFFDASSQNQKRFDTLYESVYNSSPRTSFPPYAAMGYDIATYLICSLEQNMGDFNMKAQIPPSIEIVFDFNRTSIGSGLVNTTLYWIHYTLKGVEGIKF